jgi:dihydrofolate reductase
MARISIVAAHGRNREIGKGNELLWHIPDDLKRFKRLTLGHPVILGRKTFDSIVAILGKPLPGRTNIVVTRDEAWKYPDVLVAHSLDEAVKMASEIDQQEIFIGGGANLWEQSLSIVERLYLTLIDEEKDGDAFFPAYERIFTKKIAEEFREHEGIKYRWVDLER